jgi:hypothetical protein
MLLEVMLGRGAISGDAFCCCATPRGLFQCLLQLLNTTNVRDNTNMGLFPHRYWHVQSNKLSHKPFINSCLRN